MKPNKPIPQKPQALPSKPAIGFPGPKPTPQKPKPAPRMPGKMSPDAKKAAVKNWLLGQKLQGYSTSQTQKRGK